MTMTEDEAKVLRNYTSQPKAVGTLHYVVSVLAKVALKQEAIRQATAVRAWDDLINKDDRNSPEDYPEMALITFDELAAYMRGQV